jgi:hypothetical protein
MAIEIAPLDYHHVLSLVVEPKPKGPKDWVSLDDSKVAMITCRDGSRLYRVCPNISTKPGDVTLVRVSEGLYDLKRPKKHIYKQDFEKFTEWRYVVISGPGEGHCAYYVASKGRHCRLRPTKGMFCHHHVEGPRETRPGFRWYERVAEIQKVYLAP